jgi:Flp pilus assembly protein TadD
VRLVADIEAGLAWCEFVVAAAQPRADWLKVADRFVQILRKHADHAPSHAGYGVCLAQLGDLDGAELHLRRAVELEPAMTSARANLQRVLAMRGR